MQDASNVESNRAICDSFEHSFPRFPMLAPIPSNRENLFEQAVTVSRCDAEKRTFKGVANFMR